MMWRFAFCLIACGSAAWSGQPTYGQKDDFDAILQQKNNLEERLDELETEFRSALPEHRLELRKKHREMDFQITELYDKLREKALEAYRESPNMDNQVVQILLNLALYDFQHDNSTLANESLQLLIDNGCKIRGIYDLGGMAAYRSNDYEKAHTFFDLAEKNGTLSGEGRRMRFLLDDRIKEWKEELAVREMETEADDLPRVKFVTSKGDIVLELFENEAPQTVGNFVNLVEEGYYNGVIFHRVLPEFMAQGGDPKGDGTGGPGYRIYCECTTDDARKHFAGSLAMAHSGQDTGGSQFYITYVPTPHLNGRHTVFGRVLEGMDVLAQLNKGEVPGGFLHDLEPDKVVTATVIRKRDHPYVPVKVE